MKFPSNPTSAELGVLQIIWKSGPSTARHVWETLNAQRSMPVVYTTVLKTMQTMVAKGLLLRDESARSHVYRSAVKPDKLRQSLLGEMVSTVFGGSVRELVVNALGAGKVSSEELREIRKMIDRLEGKP